MCPGNLPTLSLYLNPFEQTSRPILIDQGWFLYYPVDYDRCFNTTTNLRAVLELNNLGCLERRQGKFEKSEDIFRSALSLCESLDHKHCYWRILLLAFIHCNIGRVFFIDGDYEKALRHLSKAESILSNSLFVGSHCSFRRPTMAFFLRSVIRHTLVHIFLDLTEFGIAKQMLSLSLKDIYQFSCDLLTSEEKLFGLHGVIYRRFALAALRSVEESLSFHVMEDTAGGF